MIVDPSGRAVTSGGGSPQTGPSLFSFRDKASRTDPNLKQREEAKDKGGKLLHDRMRSQEWMQDNYYERWTQVYQNYKCEEDPHPDPNDPTKIDPSQTAIGMPDTWGIVRRFVARVTAQPPAHRFIATDLDVADRVTRAQMWQWDRAGVARIDKKHVLQGGLFGLSLRPWYWAVDSAKRTRRIRPSAPPTEELGRALAEQYTDKFLGYYKELGISSQDHAALKLTDPQQHQQHNDFLAARLVADVGRGDLVPVKYLYKHYEGPKCEFLFLGDTFLPPNYQGLNDLPQQGLIINRRRGKKYLLNLLELYKVTDPQAYDELKRGLLVLFEQYPEGSPDQPSASSSMGERTQQLKRMLMDSVDQTDESRSTGSDFGAESLMWNITERHVPGEEARLELIAEDGIWLGGFPYPYDLEGKIAFTELLFIDDLTTGVGDSVPGIIRGINKLHNRQVGQREDLIDKILKPYMVTSSRQLYDNPQLLERKKALRLIWSPGGANDLQVLGEMGAMAAVQTSLADESGIMRLIQTASGESNLSMAADVDPQQNRTATGAKIGARSADILTKDSTGMYTLSLVADLDMMRLLNRSELSEPVVVNKAQYNRPFAGQIPPEVADPTETTSATPEDFQYDGEIEVEVGSTLADDDDTKLTRAQQLFQLASSVPNQLNQRQATIELLRAMGKGKELQKWLAPPPPAPDPVPNRSGSVNIAWKDLSDEEKVLFMTEYYGISSEKIAAARSGGGQAQPGAPNAPPGQSMSNAGLPPPEQAPGAAPLSPNGLDPSQQSSNAAMVS